MSRRPDTTSAADLSADSKLAKDDKPRGIRARLRQRRARNSSEDEVRSRPTSLDLSRKLPMLGSTGAHSLSTVPTRSDGLTWSYGLEDDGGPPGLALGEFGEHCDEVAEEDEDITPSPADHPPATDAVRAAAVVPGLHRRATQPDSRRRSLQSVPALTPSTLGGGLSKSTIDHNLSDGYVAHSDYEHNSPVNSGNYSCDYSYDDDAEAEASSLEPSKSARHQPEEFDADGELNAVYLKRNADFHMLFRNIPINELLIDDYGCALQRDILVQGRLYLTENFVCFYSNIFGWVTNLVIAFDEIVSIDKKMTALIIPNAIQVATLHAKHFFGSFIYRDSAYNQLYDLWGKSRNEKTAGLPEIGRAEGGDGAGDVSRHREDVLNAYQSLSEGEDQDGSINNDDGVGYEEGSTSSSSTPSSSSSSANSDSDDGTASDIESTGALHAKNGSSLTRRLPDAKSAAVAGPAALLAGKTSPDALVSGHESSGGQNARSNASVRSANGTVMPRTAADSVAGSHSSNTPADLSRAHSHLSATTTKVAGTEVNGTPAAVGSTASMANGAAGVTAMTPVERPSALLLARLPKTPDATDAVSLASSARSAKHSISNTPLHKPTTCPCGTSGKTAHYSQEALDAVFPLPLPLLFRLVFSASVPPATEKTYMPAGLVSKEELETSCTNRIIACANIDVKTEGWVPDPSDSGLEMCIYSYERPLGFAIGPKSAVVEDTFRITTKDFDKVVVVEQVVRTPNVPSGNSFYVKIRHCLTWATGPGSQPPGGWSHYRMSFEVEWTKTSWIKGAIEKGSTDSNKQVAELLEKYVREWIAAHPDLEVKPQSAISLSKELKSAGGGGGGGVPPPHKRSRKPGRKSKRDGSPHGLRMEELLLPGDAEPSQTTQAESKNRMSLDSVGGSGRAVAAAGSSALAGPSASTGGVLQTARADAKLPADESAEAAQERIWKRRAEESWIGWACYHSVYPALCAVRRTGCRASCVLSDPIAGPVLVVALLCLLVLSNTWRISSTNMAGASSGNVAGTPIVVAGGRKGLLGSVWNAVLGPSYVHVDGMQQMRDSVNALAEQMAVINQRLQQLVEKQDQHAPSLI